MTHIPTVLLKLEPTLMLAVALNLAVADWPTLVAIVAAGLVAIGLVGYMLAGLVIARAFLGGDHHDFQIIERPEDRGLATRRFRFSPDGTQHLAGWIASPTKPLRSPNACVVMVHGFDSGKDKVWTFPDDPSYRGSMLDQGAETLVRAGFHVVAIDLRNHGESDDHGPVTLGITESDDVLATIDYLIEHADEFNIDPKRIGLRGESMGGATVLIAAARSPKDRIGCVWVDSAYADAARAVGDFVTHAGVPRMLVPALTFWLEQLTRLKLDRSSPLRWIDQITCPVFLAHSDADSMISAWHFEAFQASKAWRSDVEFWRLADHEHNRLWMVKEYHARQVEFFKHWLDA